MTKRGIVVCLTREMQRVMAAEAEATRDARAKVPGSCLLSPVDYNLSTIPGPFLGDPQ